MVNAILMQLRDTAVIMGVIALVVVVMLLMQFFGGR